MRRVISSGCFLMMFFAFQVSQANGQFDFAGFSYQGSLKDGAAPANGDYEMRFEFFDASTGGTFLGSNAFTAVPVVNGVFSVSMTATTGLMSPGRGLWIQISVRPAGSSAPFTLLAPRQRINSAPFAISSLLTYDSLRLGGIEANQYLTAASGAASFIQNTTTQQTGSFNLNGTGTANIFSAATQFDIGGNRVLSAGGADNIFAGFGSGAANTTGASNAFFGVLAGSVNTTGNFNAFFGRSAGNNNNAGNANSFFGSSAGNNNSGGGNNSFFGFDAGSFNGTGSNNTIIGGAANVTLNNLTNATALGFRAAVSQSNSLVLGSINGINGASADTNVGIGTTAPTQRLQVVGNGVFSGNLGIGVSAPTFKLQVLDSLNTGLRVQTNTTGGSVASFGGFGAFQVDAPGLAGGRFTILENGNVGIGAITPQLKLQVNGSGNFTGDLGITNLNANGGAIFVGNVGIGVLNPTNKLQVAGNGSFTGNLSVNGGINFFASSGNANFFMKGAGAANGINFGVVGNAGNNSTLFISQYDGTTFQDRLIIDLNGNVVMAKGLTVGTGGSDILNVIGTVKLNLGTGGDINICYRGADRTISTCSSSIRYKQNIQNYTPGLDLVRRLRPVSFNWKSDNRADFGLVAEEAAEVEPLLATYNEKGEVEGVKYDRVGVVLVNAVQEQQQQIEQQQKKIDKQQELIKNQQEKLDRQQTEIDALKAIVCLQNPAAKICREEKP